MKKDRYIDISVRDVDKTAIIEISHSNYVFSMNVGDLLNIIVEDDHLLLFQFDKGEIRIEVSLKELNTAL